MWIFLLMFILQISKNKGLTPHRKKEQRNPRVKNKMKFKKAKVRRKGQVCINQKVLYTIGAHFDGIHGVWNTRLGCHFPRGCKKHMDFITACNISFVIHMYLSNNIAGASKRYKSELCAMRANDNSLTVANVITSHHRGMCVSLAQYQRNNKLIPLL